jgi:molybdopterin molybdotransferase
MRQVIKPTSRPAPADDGLDIRRSDARRPTPLLSLDEALAQLLAGAAGHAIGQTEQVSTFDALGRVLAEDFASAMDVPPADNTSMDGYALRAADVPRRHGAAGDPAHPGRRGRPAAGAGHGRAHLHRRPDAARRRRGGDAGAVRGAPGEGLGAVRRATAYRLPPASGSAAAARTCWHGSVVLPPARA